MHRGDGKPRIGFIHGHYRRRLDALRRHPGIAQLPRQRHRKTTRMRRRDQFFRIGADTVFKTRAEGILRIGEHAAVGGNGALAIFQTTLPGCRSFAFHDLSPCA